MPLKDGWSPGYSTATLVAMLRDQLAALDTTNVPRANGLHQDYGVWKHGQAVDDRGTRSVRSVSSVNL